jgi:inner membrane protein
MQNSLWQKIGVIIGLTFALLIPLGMIEGLVNERSFRQQEVVADIAASSAGPQHLFGPVLAVPYIEHWSEIVESRQEGAIKKEVRERSDNRVLYFLPEQLGINSDLSTETKKRSLFKVRSYVADTTIRGNFKLPKNYGNPQPEHQGLIEFGTPFAAIVVADMRGVLETTTLEWNGQQFPFEQGSGLMLEHSIGMHADLGSQPVESGSVSLPFSFNLKLRGLEQLKFVPAGKQTRVGLSSSWQHPNFFGRFLPDPASQAAGPQGFRADWTVTSLASNVAENLYRCREITCYDSFGVKLVDPINIYSLSNRAGKYAFLFVCLTFGSIFLFEMLKSLQVHPAQYALVGLALAMFFLLLLSLAEHIDFHWAYMIASTACVGLIAFYLSAVMASVRRGVAAGALLSGLFGALYGLLQSEDNALMLGSLLLFALLTIAMMATRRIDWYRVGLPSLKSNA